ncbi:site-specific DNA-methyltransferase [[Phormidium ambiguum] IAM M-71]|uniref:Site-specific DNA-methyltransferase n=1 Tax=[Phormidium ambiguum] IAM M-71 TaxID=454136 RepID=A0A1U7ITW0_9CYAN|nr:DNA methyltransferase [Phormidium ambiguum]OKH40879.1 site-specific DNA-methyltransferase [Phormidium ambiguum IAM M-71]
MNRLYYGDNLDVLRDSIASESIDLIYLDPPFNSSADYNVIFGGRKQGSTSHAQITAFEDTWHWNDESSRTLNELFQKNGELAEVIDLLIRRLGHNDLSAYLVMMAARLVEMHRVLKPTGSLYLHCDPTASHYLKIILDLIFGARNFRNEITWKRTSAHNDPKKYGANTDIILYYVKSDQYCWNQIYLAHEEKYKARFRNVDPDGRRWTDDNLTAKGLSGGGYTYEYKGVTSLWRCPIETMERLDSEGRLHFTKAGGIRLKRYLDETIGTPLQALWDDIPPINSQAKERLGYPTQKPVALLERIIQASSNHDDIILDPFCGCGTALHAAQKLNRQWIGIDITHLAIALIESRLRAAFPGIAFDVYGTPKDLEGAKDLAGRDKYQFQWWACSLVEVPPYQGKKKGADGGIDGLRYISDFENGKEIKRKIIVSVKGGDNVNAAMVRDLIGTVQNNKADIGLLVTLTKPTKPMLTEAAKAGFYQAGNGRNYPRIQILTIEDLLTKTKRPEYFDMSLGDITFRKPEKEMETFIQPSLF